MKLFGIDKYCTALSHGYSKIDPGVVIVLGKRSERRNGPS